MKRDLGRPTTSSAADTIVPQWAAVPLAAAGGIILDGAFPDRGWWPLAFIGVGIILAALIGRSIGGAFLVGLTAGGSFYLTHIQWAALFLGPLPLIALVALQALLFGIGAVTITLAYRWVPTAWTGVVGRMATLPLTVAGLWVGREAIAGTWPYGGFSWGRVAMSQSDSPISHLFPWLGISGVSFVMVLLVAVTIQALEATHLAPRHRILPPAALAALLLMTPAWPTPVADTMRVGAVQGAGPAGYFDQRESGDLIAAQLDATKPLYGEEMDVLVWPEGSTETSPLTDPDTAAVFDEVSEQVGAPFVGWAITSRQDRTYNTAILWDNEDGAVDLYDKKHPVPFGEYIPDRAFWRPFAPDLIDLVQRDYTPGSTDPIFSIGDVPVGINICFDIVDDQVLRDSVLQGGQVIFASSNNADFGRTDQSAQQLAIARIRALELGRSVVNISTVGLSAVISPGGRNLRQLPLYTPGTILEDVPLSTTITPAASAGRQIELTIISIATSLLGIAGLRRDQAKGSVTTV